MRTEDGLARRSIDEGVGHRGARVSVMAATCARGSCRLQLELSAALPIAFVRIYDRNRA